MHTDCQLLPQTMATFDESTKVYPFTGLITLLSALTTFKHNRQHRRELYIYTYNYPSIYMYLHAYGHVCLHSSVILKLKVFWSAFLLLWWCGVISSCRLQIIAEGCQGWISSRGRGRVCKESCLLVYFQGSSSVTFFIPSGFLHKDGTTHSGLNCPTSVNNQDNVT